MRRGLYVRLLLVLGVLALATPPLTPLVVIGPQHAVHTTLPKLGMHTRLTDEVEPWKIKQTLEMVRGLGAPWVVEYFPWAYSEPEPGEYRWKHADLVVDHAIAQGLTVIGRLGFVPQWARPKDTTALYLDESSYEDFARFVNAFVSHFAGRVDHIIIWNEPNLSLEWGYRPVDPDGYATMLRHCYPAAKAANPEVTVLAGALAPTLAPPGSEWGMDDLVYLSRMYDAGAGAFFDGLAAHSYGWNFPAESPPSPDLVNFRRVELLREVMVARGDAAKDIYITEAGWNDHPRWTKAVRPAQRILNTLEATRIATEDWPWCQVLAFWTFRYPRPMGTYQDYFTFVAVDLQPKPIYYELQSYAQSGSHELLGLAGSGAEGGAQ
jgi:hypothetical protein